MKSILLVFILLSCLHPLFAQQAASCSKPATYKLEFLSTWSKKTHPQGFPRNPHFSGLIGAVHDGKVSFWSNGRMASAGIKAMAERGIKSRLSNEIKVAQKSGRVLSIVSGGGISLSPGKVAVTFKATQRHSRLTLVSMIAPSPDWFVGTDSFPLCSNKRWIKNVSVPLYVYDSGTDDGKNYESPDKPAKRPQRIYKITSSPFKVNGKVKPIGLFKITKQ